MRKGELDAGINRKVSSSMRLERSGLELSDLVRRLEQSEGDE